MQVHVHKNNAQERINKPRAGGHLSQCCIEKIEKPTKKRPNRIISAEYVLTPEMVQFLIKKWRQLQWSHLVSQDCTHQKRCHGLT